MRPQLLDLLAKLPSVRQFVHTVVEDIDNRHSVLILLPASVLPEALWSLIDRELWQRGLSVDSIDLSLDDSELTPAEIVGSTCGVEWPDSSVRDAASLLRAEGLPDVIVLNGLETLAPYVCNIWLRFISRWAELTQGMPTEAQPRSALCALLRPSWSELVQTQDASYVLPDTNVRLRIHWWWGFPSALEIKLLCRLAALESDWVVEPEWWEHLLPALIGADVTLLDKFFSLHSPEEDTLWMKHLREVAEERGWTYERLKAWGAVNLLGTRTRGNSVLSPRPPQSLRSLWSQGVVYATDEYGVELHPAALFALGRHDEIKRRLWREQVGFLFPFLDSIRLDLCGYLTRRYGNDWPVRWIVPPQPEEEAEVRKNPLSCQLGHLERLFRDCHHLQRERRWFPLVQAATNARNALAHYRTISRRDYKFILEQYALFADAVG